MNDSNDQEAIRQLVLRLAKKRFEKDISIVDDFETDAVLIGSDADEIGNGQARIKAQFQHAMRRPYSLQLNLSQVEIRTVGDVGWFYADGEAELTAAGGRPKMQRYRLTGVVGRRDGVWRWRLFHGSEPKL